MHDQRGDGGSDATAESANAADHVSVQDLYRFESQVARLRFAINAVRYIVLGAILFSFFFGSSLSDMDAMWIILGVTFLAILLLVYIVVKHQSLLSSSHPSEYASLYSDEDEETGNHANANAAAAARAMSGLVTISRNGRIETVRVDPRSLRLAFLNRNFTAEDYESLLELDRDNGGRFASSFPPAQQSQVNRLPEFTISAQQAPSMAERECVICLEHFKEGDLVRSLPCMHQFHKDCVDQWFTQQGRCPTCKLPIA
eukprot:ANDGO_02349.mRNA.1 E3 ubiquitin-protein ligase SDIR1